MTSTVDIFCWGSKRFWNLIIMLRFSFALISNLVFIKAWVSVFSLAVITKLRINFITFIARVLRENCRVILMRRVNTEIYSLLLQMIWNFLHLFSNEWCVNLLSRQKFLFLNKLCGVFPGVLSSTQYVVNCMRRIRPKMQYFKSE